MNPLRQSESTSTAKQEDQLAAAMPTTVVLPASEVDPGRIEARGQVGEWSEDDPPTNEPEILAAVQATEHEIATGKLDPAAVMNLVARQAQLLTDAGGAVIEVLDGTELVYRAASGIAAKSIGIRLDTQKSLSGLCFRTAEVMRCDDSEKDDRVDKAACRWVGIRSMVLVPVVREGRAVGVLAVISPAVAAFGERDVRTLRLLARLLAETQGHGPFA